MKEIRQELEYYKSHLSHHAPGACGGSELRGAEAPLLSRVKLAQDLNDDVALRCALSQLWEYCGGYSSERAKEVNATLSHLIDLILPPAQKYMLFAADSNSGLYHRSDLLDSSPSNGEGRAVMCVKSECGTKVILKMQDNKGCSDKEWEEIKDILQLSKSDLVRVQSTQQEMKHFHCEIQSKLKILAQTKADLVADVHGIEKLLSEEFYSQLSPKAAIALVKWLEQVSVQSSV